MKPLCSRQHLDIKIVHVLKLAYFISKICSRVLEHSAIDPKMYHETVVEKKEPKDNIEEDVIFV